MARGTDNHVAQRRGEPQPYAGAVTPSSGVVAGARQQTVTTTDGRTLLVYDAGDPDGALVVVHHGTPCSGLLAAPWAADAEQRGIRLVGFDRPGYGGSSRRPARSVSDVAADTAAVADAFGADRFRTWGVSGGGPHALACAALLPERVVAAACLAGVAPYDSPGLDWTAGMGEDNVAEFGAALAGETALGDYLDAARTAVMAAPPQDLLELMRSLLPPADLAVLTGERAEFLHAWMTSGLRPGYDGWLDDDLAFTSPWGFELDTIRVPLLVMQGEQDLMVPFEHGRWLAAALPRAETVLSADDGHLTLLEDIGRVHTWLLAQPG